MTRFDQALIQAAVQGHPAELLHSIAETLHGIVEHDERLPADLRVELRALVLSLELIGDKVA